MVGNKLYPFFICTAVVAVSVPFVLILAATQTSDEGNKPAAKSTAPEHAIGKAR
jgi:hypothetical protein